MIDFWDLNFEFEDITSNDFFKDVNKIVSFKSHVDHWHVKEKIRGFSHDFCNLKLRKSQLELSYLARNMFGYDFYFTLKCIRTSTWGVKRLSIGESKLANINFANISNK